MGNIATSVDEQIKKLEERGMVFDLGVEKVKEILLDIGYYRLGFYWNPFEIDHTHNFKKGTIFSDVVALYYLDVDLRNILLRSLNRIEINFRTKIVYYVSNKHKQSSTWFVDKKVMHKDFIATFNKHYNAKFIENNKTIKLHHKKYINDKYAPAWKTLEFFTFGTIFKIYTSLVEEDLKNDISKTYGLKKTKIFSNYMNTIIFIRNTCAHGGLLFDLNTPKEIAVTPLIKFNNNINNRHSLDSAIKVILYFLSIISKDRKEEVELQIAELFSKYESNEVLNGIITKNIGYVKKVR